MPVEVREVVSQGGPGKGEHDGPESVLEQESDLVGKMVRAFKHGDHTLGMDLLQQLGRACFIQGKAVGLRQAGATRTGGQGE